MLGGIENSSHISFDSASWHGEPLHHILHYIGVLVPCCFVRRESLVLELLFDLLDLSLVFGLDGALDLLGQEVANLLPGKVTACLLYTSDAADE